MKKLIDFPANRLTMFFVWLFAVIAPWIFYCCRIGHVFIDVVLFHGFCQALLWIMMLSAVALMLLAFFRDFLSPFHHADALAQ